MSMNELSIIELAVGDITPSSSPNDCLQLLNDINVILAEARRVKQLVEDAVLAHILAHGGKPLMVSDTVGYYASNPKHVKCLNVGKVVDELIRIGGGDVSENSPLCLCLSSGAIKHGAAAKYMDPDVFKGLFETTYPDALENGVVPKKLLRIDERFLK